MGTGVQMDDIAVVVVVAVVSFANLFRRAEKAQKDHQSRLGN